MSWWQSAFVKNAIKTAAVAAAVTIAEEIVRSIFSPDSQLTQGQRVVKHIANANVQAATQVGTEHLVSKVLGDEPQKNVKRKLGKAMKRATANGAINGILS